jgi:hypothetical protein
LSALNEELPPKVIAAWRKFLGTTEGQFGLDWVRRNCQRERGETDIQIVRAAAKYQAYMDAVDDIEERLTALPVSQASLEEGPLETPDGRR